MAAASFQIGRNGYAIILAFFDASEAADCGCVNSYPMAGATSSPMPATHTTRHLSPTTARPAGEAYPVHETATASEPASPPVMEMAAQAEKKRSWSWVRPDVFRQLYAAQDAASGLASDIATQLNLAPAFWFLLPTALFFSFVSWFLETYFVVLPATAHLAVFAVGAYIVFSSYFVCDYAMSRRSTSYASIPDDKKFYVLSNLIKSAVLFSYCPLAVHVLYEALALDQWSTSRIRNMGVLYAIPDFVSLFLVRRRPSCRGPHSCLDTAACHVRTGGNWLTSPSYPPIRPTAHYRTPRPLPPSLPPGLSDVGYHQAASHLRRRLYGLQPVHRLRSRERCASPRCPAPSRSLFQPFLHALRIV